MLSMRGPLFSIIAFFVFEGLLFAALKVLPKYMHMDTLRELPLVGIAAMIFVVPVIVTVVVFRNRSNADKAKIAFTMIGVAWLLGTTGNFISQQTRNMSEMVLIFNWLEGVIMLLGGVVCGILAYIKSPQTELEGEVETTGRADTGATRKIAGAGDETKTEARVETTKSQTETEEKAAAVAPVTTASRGLKVPLGTGNKMPAMTGQDLKTKNAMSNSASNLRGLLDTLAPDDDEPSPKKADAKPAEVKAAEIKPAAANAAEIAAKADAIAKKALEASAAASATKSAEDKPAESETRKPSASATGIPEQRRPTASSTATRLQAQKRKSTSTFIKLQALSSSGTGSTRPKTADTAGSESSESLKSILDRLDSSDDEDIDFFGSDSLLEKPDMADKPGRVSKTSMPAATPPSSSAVPAQPTRPLSSKPAPGTGTSNTQMPAQTPGSGITAPSSPAAAAAKPAAPQAKPSMKGSDTSIPSLANKFTTPAAAKAADSSAQAIPAVTSSVSTPEAKAAPAADAGVQPSLTDMLNSIKTPGAEPVAPVKPERTAGLGGGGLGSSTLGRVAGKKTGIQLGGTSSTNLNRIESIPEAPVASEPTIEIKPIPVEEPLQAVDEQSAEIPVEQFDAAPEEQGAFAEAAVEPVVETIIEPVADYVAEPVAEVVAEPLTETFVEPVLDPIAETVVEPVFEPTQEPIEQLVVEPVSEQLVEPFIESEVEPEAVAPVEEISSEDYADSVSAAIAAGSIKKAPVESFSAEPTNSKANESFTPEATESSASSDFTSFKPSFDAPSFENFESSADAMMNFAADREEPAEQAANTLFESAAVDQEIEDIFSNLVPPEAQQEVNEVTLSHTRLPAIDAMQAQSLLAPKDDVEAPKPKNEAPKAPEPEKAKPVEVTAPPAVTPLAVSAPKPEPAEKAESNTLFEVDAVDREIEDIFSNLVPPEAQQEVNESTLSHNRLQAMDRSEAKALLGRGDEEKAVAKVTEMNVAKSPVEPVKAAPVEAVKVETAASAAGNSTEATDKKEGLFDPSLDKEIDDIFFNLAPEEAQAEVNNETLAKVKAPEATSGEMSFAPPAEPEAKTESAPSVEPVIESKDKTEESFAPPAGVKADNSSPVGSTADKVADLLGSLSDESVTSTAAASNSEAELAKAEAALQEVTSFVAEHAEAQAAATTSSDITESSSTGEAAPTSEIPVATDPASVGVESDVAITPVANKPKEVKEFGRLSVKSATAGAANETVGTMKTIGKLLIDVPAIENIIKTGESGTIGKNLATARVISSQRGASINALLEKIDSFPGIAGTLIVGHDGLVISSTLKAGKDKDTIGALSVACLGSTNLGTRKLEIGKLKQMVFITDSTITVLTDVEVGILAVLLDSLEINKIDGVLQTIHDTIHG